MRASFVLIVALLAAATVAFGQDNSTQAPPTPSPPTPVPTPPVLTNCTGVAATKLIIVIAQAGSTDVGSTNGVPFDALKSGLSGHVNDMSAVYVRSACDAEVTMVDSRGDEQVAVAAYRALVASRKLGENTPTSALTYAVVVADNSDVTRAIQALVPRSVPVVSALASDPSVSDPVLFPSAMRLAPPETMSIDALLAVAAGSRWDSVAVVYSNDQYGQSVSKLLTDAFSNAAVVRAAPVVVGFETILEGGSLVDDVDMARRLLANNPAVIVALCSGAELLRVRKAATTVAQGTAPFIITLRAGVSRTQDANPAAAIVPKFDATPISGLIIPETTSRAFSTRVMVEVCGIIDAVHVVADAFYANASRTLRENLLATNYAEGITGVVTFDRKTLSRPIVGATLTVASGQARNPYGSYSVVPGTQSVFQKTPLASGIPTSPLKMVTVCILATGGCTEISDVRHLLFSLNETSATNPYFLANNIKTVPVAINTGNSGVQGLKQLINVASQCNFLTGPANSGVTLALLPIINQYTIPQIDYGSTAKTLSDKLRYPFFTRVVSSDVEVASVYGDLLVSYRWDTLQLLTSKDEAGRDVDATLRDQLNRRAVDIEQTEFVLIDYTVATNPFRPFLERLKSQSISRIAVVLLPAPLLVAKQFFDTVKELNITDALFLLGDDLCQAADANPSWRAPLFGSICLRPSYNQTSYAEVNARFAGRPATQDDFLRAGGFDVDACPTSRDGMFTPFAVDIAAVIADTVRRALTTGVSITDGPAITQLIRQTVFHDSNTANNLQAAPATDASVNPVTGDLSFTTSGDRIATGYVLNIQQWYPERLVDFGSWSSAALYQKYPVNLLPNGQPIRWDRANSTAVPRASARTLGFIIAATVSLHPGSIVLSALGFVATIVVFSFCYKHYQMQETLDQHESERVAAEMVSYESGNAASGNGVRKTVV